MNFLSDSEDEEEEEDKMTHAKSVKKEVPKKNNNCIIFSKKCYWTFNYLCVLILNLFFIIKKNANQRTDRKVNLIGYFFELKPINLTEKLIITKKNKS